MNVIDTAKIIAANTRFRDLTLVVTFAQSTTDDR
jgi:hypothetical protein